MKVYFAFLFALVCTRAGAQSDSARYSPHGVYERHSIAVNASLGFANAYRTDYSLPSGFQKNNTSGFTPIYFGIEYGLSKSISLEAAFCYDAFVYNFRQDYTGNSGSFTRYEANNARIVSGGLIAFYHLGKFIPVRHLDPFVGIGLSLNNIRYSAYPQGDSTVPKIEHTVTPYLKVGARYYISSAFSIFADAGYDQHTIVSLGFSCRFFSKKE